MGDDLGDTVAARRLEDLIWALFEQAAGKVGCPTTHIEAYYKMILDVCRPADGSHTWDPTRTIGPKLGADVLQAQYRTALEEIFRTLDPKHLERTFAAIVNRLLNLATR